MRPSMPSCPHAHYLIRNEKITHWYNRAVLHNPDILGTFSQHTRDESPRKSGPDLESKASGSAEGEETNKGWLGYLTIKAYTQNLAR